MTTRKGPALTLVGSCAGCEHLGQSIVGRSCHSSLLHEPRWLPREAETPTPAWCPDLQRATVELARALLAKEPP